MALAGCAASGNYGSLVTNGAIRIAAAKDPRYTYEMTFTSALDVGYDSHVEADRLKAAAVLLGDKCPRPTFIDEFVIETGTLPFGRPVRTYIAKVTC
jgi:hypothetical protein